MKNTTLEIIERLLTLEGDIRERSQLSSSKISEDDFDLFYLLDEEFINSYKRMHLREYIFSYETRFKLTNFIFVGDKHFGKILLQPHIPTLLKYLQKQLAKKFVKLDGLYMLILKDISAFALDEVSSCRLLDLLMPTLRSKATAEDAIVLPLLQVISDLFKTLENYDNFEKYLLQIGQLFNLMTSGIVRRALCDLVEYISAKTE